MLQVMVCGGAKPLCEKLTVLTMVRRLVWVALQRALSGYMFYEFMATLLLANYSYLCQPVDYSRNKLGMRGQFVAIAAHSSYNLFAECPFPDGFNVAVLLYLLRLLTLFFNFYQQTYLRSKRKKPA
ncbi:hypothetical protein G4228_014819 [Cervus hanglu yarkandensis]|nr:hypothetical protein G4228_014819 [Cervus hanglu yarkandensis]